MGSIIHASCICGFATEFFCGSERHNYQHVCLAPAGCPSCCKFHVLNYFAAASCPDCRQYIVFYNDPSLQASSDAVAREASGSKPALFVLPPGSCLCPRCRQITLNFEAVSCCE